MRWWYVVVCGVRWCKVMVVGGVKVMVVGGVRW